MWACNDTRQLLYSALSCVCWNVISHHHALTQDYKQHCGSLLAQNAIKLPVRRQFLQVLLDLVQAQELCLTLYAGATFKPKPLRTYVPSFAPCEPVFANKCMSKKISNDYLLAWTHVNPKERKTIKEQRSYASTWEYTSLFARCDREACVDVKQFGKTILRLAMTSTSLA